MSRETDLLTSVLPDLFAGRYVEVNNLHIFGTDSYQELLDILIDSPFGKLSEDSDFLERFKKLVDDFHRHTGRESLRGRATLNSPDDFNSDAFEAAPPQTIQQGIVLIQKSLEGPKTASQVHNSGWEEKSVERALIEEALGKVPNA